jgi:multidrug efflux system outer membrane protein
VRGAKLGWSLAIAGVLGLTGCTMEPTYRRPAAPIAEQWPDGQADANPPLLATADVGWKDFFADPRLRKLIELALEHNPDARVAALNIIAARAQYQIQRADLFPTIAASAVEQVEKYPAAVAGIATGGAAAGGAGTTGVAGVDAGSGVFRFFDVGVGFTSYEIDLFGRVRSLNHQRLQQYLGYIETRRSTQISLVASVANAYLALLADGALLKVTQDTLASQDDSLKLVQMSFDGGVATALDLHQAETTVLTARANIAQYTRQVAQDRNALVLLLGMPLPSDLPDATEFDQQQFLADLPVGLPSVVLTQRPDVLAAEHNLIAANANIGAARAAFFPSIALTGSYGTASTQLSGLFDHGSTAWTFSPQISLPIFAAGANVATLKLSKTQKNVSVVQYEQVVQTAFREVSDALVGRATLDEQLSADQALVDATAETYRLSDMRYRNGVDNFLTVLDSQRALFSAQQALIGVKLARLQNLVTLYKALGGGWRDTSVPPTNAAESKAR